MNVLWAIVVDTWKQSLKQVVFVIMLALLGIIALASFIVPQSFEQSDGSNRVGFVFSDEPSPVLEGMWNGIYVQSRLMNAGEKVNPMDPQMTDDEIERFMEAEKEAETATVPLDERAAEVLAYFFASTVFTFSMALFVAACAGYVPNMLESGAIDMVLARPAHRVRIYIGKILGGLALYGAAVFVVYLLIFLGIGIRTGVWVERIFLVLPLQLLSAAVLYSILGAIGVVSRSSTLCLVVGLVFYFLVDTAIGAVISLQQIGQFEEGGMFDKMATLMRDTLPNFGLLKGNATASVFNIPVMEWQPFLVAFAWLGLTTAFGAWWFRRSDF